MSVKVALCSVTSLLAITISSVATAQEPAPAATPSQDVVIVPSGDPNTTDDIVITGIRRSLADATALKRDNVGISDAISSEDIGRFPDQNLAESLQRVTGVQITRNKGEGARVALRGLGPNFTQTQYNGRQMATPGGGRSFSFTSLSSDFVSAVEVIKSPSAEQVEGGLAGLVNVRVARPLDAARDVVAITAEGIYEENANRITPHASLFVNKLVTDNFGASFGVNYEKRRVLSAGYLGYGAEQGIEARRNPPLDYNRDGDLNDSYRFIHTTNLVAEGGKFERVTMIGGLQYKPSATLDLYVDGFFSDFKDYSIYNEHQVRFTNIQGPNAGIVASTNNGTVLTSLDANGVDHRADTRPSDRRDQLFSGAAGGIWTLEKLRLSTEFTYSKAVRTNTSFGFAINSRAAAAYDTRGDLGAEPQVQFRRGYDPLDPSTFNLLAMGGTYRAPSVDRNYDGRLDAAYDLDLDDASLVLKAGGMFANRRSAFRSRIFNLTSQQIAAELGQPYNATVEGGSTSAAAILGKADFSKFVDPSLGIYLAPDLDTFFKRIPLSRVLQLAPPAAQLANDFTVIERSYAGYVQLNVKALDDRFNGNIGVRYVRTDQTSNGFAADLSSLLVRRGGIITVVQRTTPVSIDNSYNEWLPSANLSYDLNDRFKVRAAVARTLTRPDIGLLSPTLAVDANTSTMSARNPNLRPYLSSQIDLSLEYYFANAGLLSAAVFYKNVDNFIVNTATSVSQTVQLEEGGSRQQIFLLRQPRNGASSKIKGVELGAQVPFTFLPGPFDGLGVLGNFTYLDLGDVVVTQGQPAIPISGASTRSYNLAGYYEKSGLGIRASYNYRNGFVVDPTSTFGDGDYQRAYGQFDISASYDINRMITLNADVTNATNAKIMNDTNIGLLRGVLDNGRRVTAGVRVRF